MINSNLRDSTLLTAILSLVFSFSVFSQKISFNDGWSFAKGSKKGAEERAFDDTGWEKVVLPHDWAINGPFDPQYNARTGGLPIHGEAWYRKTFLVNQNDQRKTVSIQFDGAMYNAHIWINGRFVGNRPYGYIAFVYDITSYLEYGKENVIAVKLMPEDLSSRWYSGAGIYRNVWLKLSDKIRIKPWGVTVTTPQISAGSAQVQVQTSIENVGEEDGNVTLKTTLKDAEGEVVATRKSKLTAVRNRKNTVSQQLKISRPNRWGIKSPYLYQVSVEILKGDEVLDTEVTPLGIRTVEYTADKGLLLNGEVVKIQGVCLHHDQGPLGAAINYRAKERQVEIMQTMGVNSIRTSHNPPSPELVTICDQKGVLLQVEAFDVWKSAKVPNGYNKFFDQWHEEDLRTMIRQFKNNPSVIMWSIGNEIKEQWQEDGWKLAKKLTDIAHDEDPTRLVTAGFNGQDAAIKNKLANQVDIVGFNYKPLSYERITKEHPDWIIVASETSSCTSTRGAYHLPIEKYKAHDLRQVTSYDIIGPVWAYPPDIEFHHLEKSPNVIGEYIWTGFDYLGEPTPYGGRDNSTNGYWNDDWPSRSSYFGAVDLVGFPKDRYYLYQSQWTNKPMIHLLPHWNWEGMEGAVIPVYSYTNCDEAELFLNGKSLGKRFKGKDTTPLKVDFTKWESGDFQTKYRLRWDVPYEPGEIKVIGYRNSKAIVEKSYRTAGAPARIRMVPDRRIIKANGYDLSYVTVLIEDSDGNLCPNAENLVRFKVSGAGSIAGVGNGNPATVAPFNADYRRAFYGKCMLIVKSSQEAGEIEIEAISERLRPDTLSIMSRK